MTKTFSSPAAGPGASYCWSGNSKAGEGKMTITDSKVGEFVAMNLEFTRPFPASNQVRFTLTPSEGGTRVSWIMEGKNNFMTKAFQLIVSMDSMCGKMFAEGLATPNPARVAQAPTTV